jgi:hypothetical protein
LRIVMEVNADGSVKPFYEQDEPSGIFDFWSMTSRHSKYKAQRRPTANSSLPHRSWWYVIRTKTV